MHAFPAILEFSEVTIESSPHYETGLWNSSFELNQGELLLVRIERENERLPLADATEGLVPPMQGSVMFLGEDWQGMSADHAAAQRGTIGRLFDDEGWIGDLDVDQNILLAQRHHTQRSEGDILEEALKFARMFGLPGLPRGRPGSGRRWDLRKAACVRSRPAGLHHFREPVRGVYADSWLSSTPCSPRANGGRGALDSHRPAHLSNPAIHATTRARMFGWQLQTVEEES